MNTNSDYNIEKPLIKDKKWIIFPNSIFSNLELSDCNDAMEGKCYTNKTFNQCISLCENSPQCNFGYYISDLPGKNICIPLKDHKVDSNPVYKLRNKNIYPALGAATTKVFFKKDKYPFPPEDANTLFFRDNFNIQNVETGTLLETSPISSTGEELYFTKNGDLIVQILQIPPDLSTDTHYIPIKYGDPLVFNIPNTSLIMRENPENNNNMEWVPSDIKLSQDISYSIQPIMKNKKIGDKISLSDTFSIHTNVSILGVNKHSLIEKLYYNTYKQAKNKNKDVTFRFIPKMKGWYCNNNSKCTEIPLEKMVVDNNNTGTYNGFAIGRNPGCWGVCKYKIKNQPRLQPLNSYNKNQPTTYIILLQFAIIIFILILFICLYLWNRRSI